MHMHAFLTATPRGFKVIYFITPILKSLVRTKYSFTEQIDQAKIEMAESATDSMGIQWKIKRNKSENRGKRG